MVSPKQGDLITVAYEDRDFDVIVIDPDGLGPGLPSVGFGFRQAARYLGIPQQTLTSRVTELDGVILRWRIRFQSISNADWGQKERRSPVAVNYCSNVYAVVGDSIVIGLDRDSSFSIETIQKMLFESVSESISRSR